MRSHATTRRAELLGPDEVAFLLCVEANDLDAQALLLCASIRRFGGRYSTSPIVAVAPRKHLWLSAASQRRLEALDVSYVALDLNQTGSSYGTINRIVVGAWAETALSQPYLVVLDTDMIFVSEPRFVRADAGVRPVDVKGSATTGPDDPLDPYWRQLGAFVDFDIDRLPRLHTTVDHQRIRASYNGGFSVLRRDLGILQRTAEIFAASFAENMRPQPGMTGVKASTGLVGAEASEWWGSSQAALSIAIWSTTTDVHVYDDHYNIPAHSVAEPTVTWPKTEFGQAVLVHYHYLAQPRHQQLLLAVMAKLGVAADSCDWIREHLVDFHDPAGL